MSQTQKLSMKSARDRPSSNLGFNLQTTESKPPRDRSQQAIAQHHHGGAASGKADRSNQQMANPLGQPLRNSFFNLTGGEGVQRQAVNQTMVVPNKMFKHVK